MGAVAEATDVITESLRVTSVFSVKASCWPILRVNVKPITVVEKSHKRAIRLIGDGNYRWERNAKKTNVVAGMRSVRRTWHVMNCMEEVPQTLAIESVEMTVAVSDTAARDRSDSKREQFGSVQSGEEARADLEAKVPEGESRPRGRLAWRWLASWER